MGKFFGTDGVRGVANTELTPQLAFDLGRFGAHVLTSHNKHTARILVGKDTRISGDMLESALVSGILSVGAHAELIGIVPTPAVSYLTRKYAADAGVVISASHNSVEYNGIKFFNQSGFKLSDEIEDEIEAYILGKKVIESFPIGNQVGRKSFNKNATQDYIEFAMSAPEVNLEGQKIAVDCANGANFYIAPETFRRLGADVHVICDSPDGTNINENCGSTHIGKLCEYVKATKADIGLAFDGDADRLIAVDENGEVIDGDVIMGLYAIYLKEKGKLKNNLVVATVMSNMGLTLSCKKHGIDVIQTKVGDRYVLEKMLEKDSVLGGEQSGHIISLLDNTTGDGLVCALHLLSMLKNSGKSASQLRREITILPQVLVNAKVQNQYKADMLSDLEILQLISKIEQKYSSQGRLLVRPSGTEPVVRVMLEGVDLCEMKTDANSLASLLESKFSV